ncbi:hypothetical protein [Phreatobacter stygius]|uniref:Uncharacterized protein n=1 Tax=Phreatobacter stygius TaxID=1940610 RepID=A0A4D7B6J0_9HYPH|nr:hypothetical protein [Phreatobacter stygius]QCI65830.1 hypothetical protein E8M01_17395 [Phreatobacter stygius]
MGCRARGRLLGAALAVLGATQGPAWAQGADPLGQCATSAGVAVRAAGSTLCFSGEITRASAERAMALLAADRSIATMVITSNGGEVTVSLRLARAIRARGLTLVVQRQCVSSCANFLFTAARRKVVAPRSLVVFHGGIAPAAFGGLFGGGGEERELLAQTEGFFREIGVNGAITYDQPPLRGSRDGADEWAASPAALARHGVRGIVSMWWPDRASVIAEGRAQGMNLGILD